MRKCTCKAWNKYEQQMEKVRNVANETKENDLEEQIWEMSNDLKVADGLIAGQNRQIEDLEEEVRALTIDIEDLHGQLDYADTQLEKMYHEIEKRDKIIDELLILAKEV